MKARPYLLCLLCLVGCTASRTLPIEMDAVQATFDASEEDIFFTTQQVFVQAGYPLDRTERATGTIATEARRVTGQEVQIRCSGMPDTEHLQVSFAARVQKHTLTLRAQTDTGPKASHCISSGVTERAMIEKIRAAIYEK
jgi:hypothetical protein